MNAVLGDDLRLLWLIILTSLRWFVRVVDIYFFNSSLVLTVLDAGLLTLSVLLVWSSDVEGALSDELEPVGVRMRLGF